MNLLGACYILKKHEEKKIKVDDNTLKEAQKLVLIAQTELIALKEQIKII